MVLPIAAAKFNKTVLVPILSGQENKLLYKKKEELTDWLIKNVYN